MNIQDFGIWFLLLSLFVPRITLFFWWVTGNLPFNTTPFVADFFASIFLPRILILVWIYQSMGVCAWFWIHLIVMLVMWIFNAIRLAVAVDKK